MHIPTSASYNEHWQQIKIAIKQDKLLYYYVIITSTALYVLSLIVSYSSTIEYNIFIYLKTLLRTCYFTFIAWSTGFYFHLLYNKTPHPLGVYITTLVRFFTPLSKSISFILLTLTLNFTFSCYSYLKALIPALNTFKYDTLFYELDKWIHFGLSPWEITHSIFPNAFFTHIINLFYHAWFLFMWGTTLFFVIRRDIAHLRNQYLLSFMASWLLIGGIAATLLSSAGPCFSYLLNPENDFYLPLMERLANQNQQLISAGWFPIWALDVQEFLWFRYVSLEGGVGAGISAMPSMHVSIATLIALAIYPLNKKLGYLMWGYMVVILVGSVHLAWHYAIDGYLSIILTLIVWKICGYISRRFNDESYH